VLIIDDTPNNDIENLCEQFRLKFNQAGIMIAYIRNHRERSISIARNIGVRKATGEILFFIDTDILPLSEYIEKVLRIFNNYPNAIGVGGWFSPPSNRCMEGFRYHCNQILRVLFSLQRDSRNRCKNFEYPATLSNTIFCQYLLGGAMSFRRRIFNEFQFDESLKAYSFGEDFLFSNLISKKYSNSLLLAPDARCINVASEEARLKGNELFDIKIRNGKYILAKLWGAKGLFLFARQYFGLVFFDKLEKIKAIAKNFNY